MRAEPPAVVVWGHRGTLGPPLLERLGREGRDVRGWSSAEADLLDAAAVRDRLGDLPEGSVVVLAAAVSPHRGNGPETCARNVRMIANFAAAASGSPLGGVVYLGSVDVYGASPPLPIAETTPTDPATPYAVAKLAGEQLLRATLAGRFPFTVLRLPGVYGPSDGGRSVVGRLLRALVAGDPVVLEGGGQARRDYVWARDVAEVLAALLPDLPDACLNVATGDSRPVREVVEVLARAAGAEPRLRLAPPAPGAAGDLVFDTRALRRAVPGLVMTPLEGGAAVYAAHLRREGASSARSTRARPPAAIPTEGIP